MHSSPEIQVPLNWILAAPAVTFFFLRFLIRWLRRENTHRRAQSWPAIEAVVNNSFELNESSRNIADEDSKPEYMHVWITAIQYSYQVNGEFYAGSYFLPYRFGDSGFATDAGRAWVGRKITIRYNPSHPEESAFLQSDGAPGKPHIPSRADRPLLTTLSLRK